MAGQRQIVERILGLNMLAYRRILTPQKGYRNTSYPVELNDGRMVNVILYKQEQGIAGRITHSDALSDFLAARALPTRQTLSPIIKLADSRITCYARCYNYLPGTTIPWDAYTMKHLKTLGQTMAEMHRQLAAFPVEPATKLGSIHEQSRQLLARMTSYFETDGVRTALSQKLKLQIDQNRLTPLLDNSGIAALPQQGLHMDFVRGNVLFADSNIPRITGIIDFEKAAYGPTVYDIARTVAFLIVDCAYKPGSKIIKYFLTSGYCKHGQTPLSTMQLQAIAQLTRFFLLHDFYKFLRHNPYEFLQQNQHFVRTRDFLLKDGIIIGTTAGKVEVD